MLGLKKMYRLFIRNHFVFNNRINFEIFIKENLRVSEIIYHSNADLRKSNDDYHGFISGSDQVWNYITAGFDKSYFLDFVNNNNLKFSYAASFGVDTIPLDYTDTYKNLLSGYTTLSVREESGKKIIKEIIGVDAHVNIDPTLLLDKDEWGSISSIKTLNYDYILIYLMAESKNIYDYAKKLGKQCWLVFSSTRMNIFE
jgi:hypothetical protein